MDNAHPLEEGDLLVIDSGASFGGYAADVTRTYIAPDGTLLTFSLPQFYRFTQGGWHRSAPPGQAA